MKKFEFKLNADAPGQHTAILVLAFVAIWVSVLDAVKNPRDDPSRQGPKAPYAVSGQTIYDNPNMTWYEKYFCRGYQRASFCSYRLLHPFKEVFDDHGIKVKESPPKKNVIHYRGPLPKNRSLRSKIMLGEER